MSSNRRIRRDDFDIESIERIHGRDHKSHTSGSRTRSHSRKRSYSRHLGSRSRSRSVDRRRRRRDRDSYSPGRSRSRSRSHGRGHSRRTDRRHASRKYRDCGSRSNSRSRSRSKSYGRHRSGRYRYDDEDKYRKNPNSRSRSRSSSHFRDFNDHVTKKNIDSPLKPSTSSSSLVEIQEENAASSDSYGNLEDLPLPQQKSTDKKSNDSYQFDEDEPIDRARIHKEIEEKLRAELAKEGKVYPPPKPEASHPVFANDGSFLEIFKKMQQAQASTSSAAALAKPILPAVPVIAATANPSTAPYLAAAAAGKSAPPPPLVGRRRGGKILKTGVVAKPKMKTDSNTDPKDFWSLYLAEVNKYKNTACETEQGNRPLVK